MMHIHFEVFFTSDATKPLAQKNEYCVEIHERYIQEIGFS